MLKALHWLPVKHRVQYKIATTTYKLRLHKQPAYLYELISEYRPNRSLRSETAVLMSVPPLGS